MNEEDPLYLAIKQAINDIERIKKLTEEISERLNLLLRRLENGRTDSDSQCH